ncbi:threonine transporter RhtB [Geomonas limicola]|uniref:Threonine transporter RhtB n=1 Tax=Geomonas limicola TaxID=2740186 RepID=A0A6V8N638_9BACT|nr:DMT family transporter [Geomonas limicola]GFO68028.1 threonine transporter RhtB [Geomonas limicola]
MVSITTGASLAKSIFPIIGSQLTTALRLGLAAVVLSILFRSWQHHPSREELKRILPYGAALAGMNLLFYLSIARIPLGIALALEFTGPLAVALYGTRQRQDLLWVLFAVTGVALLLPITDLSAPLDPLGLILALAAGVFWGIYILAGRRLALIGQETGMRGGIMVAWGMLTAALVVAPVGLITSTAVHMNARLWMQAFGVGVLSSAVPYSLEMVALKQLPTRIFGILTSLEPVVGALSGFIFLSERLSWMQALAIALIVIASAGSTYVESRRKHVEAMALP